MDVQIKENETIEELLIDGLKIIQNVELYRFTSDSVLLTRFAKAKADDKVADFCAGSGIVGIHFYALNKRAVSEVTLFEMQEELSDMSRRTIELNGLSSFVCVNEKIQDIGKEYNEYFSLVLCNPPYEKAEAGFSAEEYKKAVCRKEITVNLNEIINAAYKSLKFGGRLAIINRADRVAELLYLMKARGIEPKRIQAVAGSESAKPYLIMVEGTKGGKEGCEFLPTLIN